MMGRTRPVLKARSHHKSRARGAGARLHAASSHQACGLGIRLHAWVGESSQNWASLPRLPRRARGPCRQDAARSLVSQPAPLHPLSITACLKDLQRFLRRDDPATRPAFTHLARFNLAKSDLVPLLTRYADDE